MELPFATIVVPALNAQESVIRLLDSLLQLSYPADRIEIILADNGSRDQTRLIASRYPVTVVVEDQIRGSYAARNKALSQARGEVLAFTDVDCVVDPLWLTRGVAAMEREGADLVAGRIVFMLPDPPTGAEAYDALVHMDNEALVTRQQTAVTANLLVRARVFASIGPFPVQCSGGDSIFTARAVREGFRLVYAADAIVRHPARGLREMLGKSWRVGTGFWQKRRDAGRSRADAAATIAKALVPPSLGYIRRLIERRGTPSMTGVIPRIWAAAYAHALIWSLSALLSLIRRRPW